ncbi:MAG: elongation factor P [Candidatus Kerfeldbacteria bacterium CG08_land_8_20_14_0_20_42_7]|uniref:Elongation factor P n=1 Tax=Candidatus Kerfeldbacteria bacterium CG08_land_8_20_14_0_20_42_7 TaxID=2014245 RepID=A0A2H0YTD8_9BACT|nr:MAG: elongation factor P [Candidatus Kerfeldbacteria bacterium CG08_land_8_20_14_0_20_42_7]
MYDMNDLRVGTFIQFNGEPYEIVDSSHMKMGRGKAVMRTKLRHLVTGNTLENTFKANDRIPEADLSHSKASFLYGDDESLHFMDQTSFEQFFISKKSFEEKARFLKDGLMVDVMLIDGTPATVQIPKKIEYVVKDAPPGVKGDTATNVFKTVTLENDLEIRVPLFINTGDKIIVNTDTGDYTERAN